MSCSDLVGKYNKDSSTSDSEESGEKKENEDHEDMNELSERMQIFVEDIASYARKINSNFIIIPQNSEELAFNEARSSKGIRNSYIEAVDGFGIEELFYNDRGRYSPDNSRIRMLTILKEQKQVMVSDYVLDDPSRLDSIKQNQDRGFISFQRSSNNYDYLLIPPESITDENEDDINRLSDARNYLYMICPNEFSGKQAMINAIADTNYDVVLIDLFFDNALTKADTQQLKTKANGGKRLVISYISIGSAETYRYYWQKGWQKGSPSWLKKNYEGYSQEFWVEFWHPEWRNIIFGNDNSYIKRIIDAGFDGAYLDNVEAYSVLGR